MSDYLGKYGPWALVAGASEGLGEAFADRLALRGINLVLVARREHKLLAVAKRIRQEYHPALFQDGRGLTLPRRP